MDKTELKTKETRLLKELKENEEKYRKHLISSYISKGTTGKKEFRDNTAGPPDEKEILYLNLYSVAFISAVEYYLKELVKLFFEYFKVLSDRKVKNNKEAYMLASLYVAEHYYVKDKEHIFHPNLFGISKENLEKYLKILGCFNFLKENTLWDVYMPQYIFVYELRNKNAHTPPNRKQKIHITKYSVAQVANAANDVIKLFEEITKYLLREWDIK